MKIIHYHTIDSTNDEAKRLIENGEKEETLIIADIQTKGRGRMGRSWLTFQGNFFGSYIIKGKSIRENPELSFLIPVSVIETLKDIFPEIICLCKWPNDIMLNNRKVCGILLEMVDENKVIAGIGINLQSSPSNKDTAYPATSILEETKILITPMDIADNLTPKLEENLALWRTFGFPEIREKWLKLAYQINQPITIKQLDKTISGIFKGIDEIGRLILIDALNKEIKINVGDVIYERQNKN